MYLTVQCGTHKQWNRHGRKHATVCTLAFMFLSNTDYWDWIRWVNRCFKTVLKGSVLVCLNSKIRDLLLVTKNHKLWIKQVYIKKESTWSAQSILHSEGHTSQSHMKFPCLKKTESKQILEMTPSALKKNLWAHAWKIVELFFKTSSKSVGFF